MNLEVKGMVHGHTISTDTHITVNVLSLSLCYCLELECLVSTTPTPQIKVLSKFALPHYVTFGFQGNYDEMMKRYKQLLTYIKSAVTRNYSEKSINSILDYISTSKQVRQQRKTIVHSAQIPLEKGGRVWRWLDCQKHKGDGYGTIDT